MSDVIVGGRSKRKYFCLIVEGFGIFVIDHMIYNGLCYFISKLAAHQKRQITLPEEW
jgi:hypothetical protein